MNKTAIPGMNNLTSPLAPAAPMPPALPLGKPAAPIGKGLVSPQLKSAAWALGYLFSYRFPKAEAFQKVAKALNTNEHALRVLFKLRSPRLMLQYVRAGFRMLGYSLRSG